MKIISTIIVIFFSHSGWGFDIEGHRGARAIHPENTLAAFEYALQIGVTTLEMDMHVTRDNFIVMTHDAYITSDLCQHDDGKKLSTKLRIRDLTLSEIKTFDCGSVKQTRFPKQVLKLQRIPTLDEVFELIENSKLPQSKTVQFNIETKIVPGKPDDSPSPDEFVDLFLKVVKKHNMLSRTILQSFDHRTLVIAKKKEPRLKIAALIGENLPDLVVLAKNLKADIVSPNFDWLTKEDVQRLHQKKIQVIPWTVNDPKDWQRMIDIEVDGIISDDPEALKSFIDSKK